jgi:hypothetical protein
MARLTLRVDFGEQRAVGPGKIRLLELIDEHGSIAAAGRAMRMSYRRAWLLIDNLNQCFRQPLVRSRWVATAAAARRSLPRAPHREAPSRHGAGGRQAPSPGICAPSTMLLMRRR